MKTVYLIRHGLPDFPDGKKMCIGITDLPLCEEGLRQAEKMAEQLPPVTAVFSSDLIRASQTAAAIGQAVTVLKGLREMDAGEWDGLTFPEIRQRYPRLYAARGIDPTLPLPGAEGREEAMERFCSAMEEAAQASPGDFAVVAHGGILALFLEKITGTWIKPDYCEVIPVVYKNGRFCPQEV